MRSKGTKGRGEQVIDVVVVLMFVVWVMLAVSFSRLVVCHLIQNDAFGAAHLV